MKKNSDDCLKILKEKIPDFEMRIYNQSVCDFGCGEGQQAIAMAIQGAKYVIGVDPHPRSLNRAIESAAGLRNIEFMDRKPDCYFDVVISQNAMEHFPYPEQTFKTMRSLLKDRGLLIITFGPPWFSPMGSHMNFFCAVPWINLLLPEWLVMKWRSKYRNDGAKKYGDVEMGLNKMSVNKFENIIKISGMKTSFKKYDCVKGLNWLGAIPGLRELFINHITVVLEEL